MSMSRSHRDQHSARACAHSIGPTSTDAAKVFATALPEYNGRPNGFSLRVLQPNVSTAGGSRIIVYLGLTHGGDEASFECCRTVEVNRGRVCMLATIGYNAPGIIGKLLGYPYPSAGPKVPNGQGAAAKVPGTSLIST